jgi:hypothetical protein
MVSSKVHNESMTAPAGMDEIFTIDNGIRIAPNKNRQDMKKNRQILRPRARLSLGDLILAVSSCTKDTKETVATVADLFASGRVRLQNNGRFMRARVC